MDDTAGNAGKGIGAAPKHAGQPPWRTALKWSVIVAFFLVTFAVGFLGFHVIRPPQQATLRAPFTDDTEVIVGGRGLQVELLKSRISSLLVDESSGQPLDIQIPLSSTTCKALGEALGSTCESGSSIALRDTRLELAFEQPVSALITAEALDEMRIRKQANADNAPVDIVGLGANDPGGATSPILSIKVISGSGAVTVKKDGSPLPDVFRLEAAPSSTVLSVQTPALGRPLARVQIVQSADRDFAAQFQASRLEVLDANQGVLAIGSGTYTLGRGERLRVSLHEPHLVQIDDDRIALDARPCSHSELLPWAADGPCVESAVRNGVVELVPRWFNTWPAWGQQLWAAAAIGAGTAFLFWILRRYNLWFT